MPDITLCKDIDCPSREKCYRFTAKPSKGWQSVFATSPRLPDSDKCLYFMDNTKP